MSSIGQLVARRALETITVASVNGHSSAGDPTYAAQRTMAARVERSFDRSADGEGEQDGTAHRIFTTEQIILGDLIWLAEDNVADQDAAVIARDVSPANALDGTRTHWVTIAS